MNYPKPVMKINELTELGFSRTFLLNACHSQHAKKFVFRNGKRGDFMIDTQKFDQLNEKGAFAR